MCTPTIAIGMTIGAATSAATGGDLQSIALGAAMGGAGAHFGGLGAGSLSSNIGGQLGASTSTSFINAVGSSITQAGVAGATAIGLGAGYVQNQLFASPEFPTYDTPQQTAGVQQFNSQQIATTGSGGRQASASLAEAIQRSKQRKLSQADVGDLSIDTSAFASTGLQLA